MTNEGLPRWYAVTVALGVMLLLAACSKGSLGGEPSLSATTPPRALTPTLTASLVGSSSLPPVATWTPTPCRNAAAPAAPFDLTVPDGTVLHPGEVFTKVWQVINTGTCTWNPAYAVVWFAGPPLGAPRQVPLHQIVPPGHAVTLAVDMVAPLADGVYQSYWKLRAPSGTLFGIGVGGGDPFWVRIRVASGKPPTATPTPTLTPPPTATPTPTPSPSPTPVVQAEGRVALVLGDGLEVDGEKTSATDLLYLFANGAHVLRPQDAARWGVFGMHLPSPEDCHASAHSAADLPVDSLQVGTYLCYRSSDGHEGYACLEAVNRATWRVVLSFRTWVRSP